MSALTLPNPAPQYDVHDQAQVRHIIARALASLPNFNPALTALGASGTVPMAPQAGISVWTLTPTAAVTINGTGKRNALAFLIVTTSGTTSYTLTFGSNFKSTGTLSTGTVSGKVFVIAFIGDGTNLNEITRTPAM